MLYPYCIVCVGKNSGRNTNRIALFGACMILCLFMALRKKSIGVDTKYYCYVFHQFSKIPWSKVFTAKTYATEAANWTFNFEPGYRLYNKLLSCISDWEQFITIGNSIIIFTLLYRLILKNSANYLLSIWLYITLGIFQTEMNVTRNAIAILLVYNSFQYIEQKKFWKYVLCCVVAASFHVTAVVFIPVYWIIDRMKISVPKCVSLVLGCVMLGMIFPIISNYLLKILPYGLHKYLVNGNHELQSILIGVLNAGIFGIGYLLNDKESRKNIFVTEKVGMMMLVLNLCSFGVTVGFGYASRLAALFGPYLIITIPRIVDKIQNEKRRTMAISLITVISGLLYIARLCINNIGGTMPYQFFWQ